MRHSHSVKKNYLLLGTSRTPLPGGTYHGGWMLLLDPADFRVVLIEGPTAHYPSAVKDLAQWLDFRPRYVKDIAGRPQVCEEAPGWFVRKLQEANGGWFVGIAQRIAGGESVKAEEVILAYAANNDGASMPQGSLDLHIKTWVRLNGAG